MDVRTNNVLRARFTTNGQLELLNTGQSVFIGEGAGTAHDNSATRRNVFVGFEAGNDVTTGVNNTALGWGSLDKSVGGLRNTVIGTSALDRDTDPEDNVAIGGGALSNSTDSQRNVAIGDTAGANTDGPDNVYIGHQADYLNANAGATRNVIIGSRAGHTFSGGGVAFSGRIAIGYQAGNDPNILTNNTLVIKNSDSKTPLIGGDFDTDRIGINVDMTGGGANLTHTLTVGGDVKATNFLATTSGTNYADYVFEDYFGKDATINSAYKFTTLKEAISFVKKNGHLPNVKSYKEIKANNFEYDLGETSLKNLEKIEENFLYIKELNEALENANEENALLKKQLNSMLKRIEALENK